MQVVGIGHAGRPAQKGEAQETRVCKLSFGDIKLKGNTARQIRDETISKTGSSGGTEG